MKKSNRIFFTSLLLWVFSSFISGNCQAQYSPGYYTVSFGQTDGEAAIFTYKISPADSLQVIELLISVRGKASGSEGDSAWFKLRGPEDLKIVRSSIEPRDRSVYQLKYEIRKITASVPSLALELYSRKQYIGKVNLQIDLFIDRMNLTMAPASPSDTLTFHPNKYRIPCSLSSVKQLVAPALPERKPIEFKRQVR
ncbi:hypothetical protein [Adhaeribacter soli]|uniref:Uncharacterized protein n=1 Tax=Adhaeribacter soli TaxID=2607655 RepID=A0A5N1IMV7_9BACT|nr:hypothetical protein [Adhaeribacter soli]KAA9331187.1 hypothetical protein F0P94_14955 [Adhaeribacter soli]